MMMESVLVEFGIAANSFNFNPNFKVLKSTPDSVPGWGPSAHQFEGTFHKKTHSNPTKCRSVLKFPLGYISY